MAELELPNRYEPLAQLGKGGGGEVWAVRDRHSGRKYALKVLAEGASEREMSALVREAVALSGLEGLGVPRVVRFGRLPRSGRAFLVRELVEGQSLEELMDEGASLRALTALARAADQLTVLHRAGLFHGDVKPANIVVETGGRATFVDLGLAAPFREGGSQAEGLTPRYAAPELLRGAPLTVRAEVYALGITLTEIVSESRSSSLNRGMLRELTAVAERATLAQPSERYPSVDEFANALRRAAGLSATPEAGAEQAALWPVVGIETTSARLLDRVRALEPSEHLRIVGAPGSGRTALLRRVAWSLGLLGSSLAWVEDVASASSLNAELGAHASLQGVLVLVDDADALNESSLSSLVRARAQGARLVTVGGASWPSPVLDFVVPPLDEQAAIDLLRGAVPSLTQSLLKRVFEVSEGRPGELRRLVRIIASDAVASAEDLERVLGDVDPRSVPPSDPLTRARYFLERGRYNDVKASLESLAEDQRAETVIARARLRLGLGDASGAAKLLQELDERSDLTDEERGSVALYLARTEISLNGYQRALGLLEPLLDRAPPLCTEALAYRGLALSMLGKHEEAREAIELSLSQATQSGALRLEAIALTSLGFAAQRCDRNDEAGEIYRRAISAAERASDAGALATIQLNLAGLLKIRGDIAGAIEHFEAAVDMGRRSGRRSSALQALLNLANTDLFLGRLARARGAIDTLEEQRSELSSVMCAQLLGLSAELLLREGHVDAAVEKFDACASAFEALSRAVDAAEARLEGVLAAVRMPRPDLMKLRGWLSRSEADLAGATVHRSLLLLASARLKNLLGDELGARANLDDSLAAARASAQKDWVWRALEARAELEEAGGQPLLARRDREEALAVLEEIGARLPRDLREVYWNDPRRRTLRASVPAAIGVAATEFLPFNSLKNAPLPPRSSSSLHGGTSASISQLSSTPLEQRLARILEVNSRLVGELDLARLTERVTDYAVELSRAEHGFVLLKQASGALTVYTQRSRGADAHAEFSRSIAESVVKTGEPVLTLNAQSDARMQSFASVHQMLLESVVCVPILAPHGEAIGALYLETRVRPGAHFERELPTLRAFADQVAIALENARLINENKERADALASANEALEEAQERLRELLDGRTEQLKRARQKLRDAREALYGHFGYQGLVGTSAAMRRVYALIDRVRDTDVPVLITGESGTGKEMVARAIHSASARAKARTLGVNCGAIPENLLESELFGHVKGAFTGADRDRKGLFRDCQGGTILLDEIGETPLKMQAGLLRVLQERRVRPVGGNREEEIDVRMLFATNRDLSQMVATGKFREDLYYRIHVVEIRVPALRERPEDIPQLVDHFLGLFAARYKREKNGLTKEALQRLGQYSWPGNVRQLENVLLNAWVLSEDLELDAADFDIPDGWVAGPTAAPRAARESTPRGATIKLRKGGVSEHRREERDRILEALRASNWNRVKAAEISGIPRRTFYRRLREYGIQ
ncbi:MAG TPA: sigma 54-interacting transcriptional regulator [Polyangiaceae bacterium]|nr:sigma 54-interacting transcriptional regulator [Polyangiaceae bacterium]